MYLRTKAAPTDGVSKSATNVAEVAQVGNLSDRRRLLFIVNVGWFFLSHRLPLAISAHRAGYEVHVAMALDPRLDRQTAATLAQHGLVLHELDLSRSGAGLFEICRQGIAMWRLLRRIRPHTVHLVTLKPILLGGIAARLARLRRVVLAVPGRGSVFSQRGFLCGMRRWCALLLYRLAYVRGRTRVIIQNEEDRDYFVSRGVFHAADVRLIRGSGVDIEKFTPATAPSGVPTVVLASRMLKEKGIADFVAAAQAIQRDGICARFALVGEPDPGNPLSHTEAELRAWAASGAVEWWGLRSDMNAVFAAANIVCLPTAYGEGVPKVLIEAAACGRPIVTTDAPGCRDIVHHRHNGLLVPPHDAVALTNALRSLLSDPFLCAQMGINGRQRVVAQFSQDLVANQTLNVYRDLIS